MKTRLFLLGLIATFMFAACSKDDDNPNTLPKTEAELKTNISKKWDIASNNTYKSIEFKADGTYVVIPQSGANTMGSYTVGTDLITITLSDFGTVTLVNLTADNLKFNLKLKDGTIEITCNCTPNEEEPVGEQGTKILFVQYDNEKEHYHSIYIADSDGSNVKKIFTPEQYQFIYNLAYASKESKIVLTLPNEVGNKDDNNIYTVSLTGENLQNLGITGEEVAVSRDGKYIAYTRGNNIYTCTITGKEEKKLTNYSATEDLWAISPTWSADSKSIVYVTSFEDESTALNIINADGTNPKVLIANNGEEYIYDPQISPDGKYICYDSDNSIAICDIDGKNEKTIIKGDSGKDIYTESPKWMPDCKSILFLYGSGKGEANLAKINIDGTGFIKYDLKMWGIFCPISVKK